VRGDDALGRVTLDALRAAGVAVDGVITDAEAATGITVALARPDDRAILTAPGALARMRAEDVPNELLAAARHVHVTSPFLQAGLHPGLRALAGRAPSSSLDTGWDPREAWDVPVDAFDVLFPNAEEVLRLAGRDDGDVEAAARDLAARGPLVVVKLGAEGRSPSAAMISCARRRHASMPSTRPVPATRSTPGSSPRGSRSRVSRKRSNLPARVVRSAPAHAVADAVGGSAEEPHRRAGPAMLMGPCRYSNAGYASVHAWAASRSFSAPRARGRPSSRGPGTPTGRPVGRDRQRQVERAPGVGGRRRDIVAHVGARKRLSAVVAKRVCTTEASSAKSSTTTTSAASATGVPGTAVIATVRAPSTHVSACATSVVVPDRESATTVSYARPAGARTPGTRRSARARGSRGGPPTPGPCTARCRTRSRRHRARAPEARRAAQDRRPAARAAVACRSRRPWCSFLHSILHFNHNQAASAR
jgi:hypothetical protein